MKPTDRVLKFNLILGMLGALMLAAGDWLMIFGDPAHKGNMFWLSEGVKHIPAWRNTLALALGIPGVIFSAIALLSLEMLVKPGVRRMYWRYLTSYSLLPWLTVHTVLGLQLFTFGWMSRNGHEAATLPLAEAMNAHFFWMALICYLLITVPFILWLVMGLRGKLRVPKPLALVSPVITVPVLVLLRPLIPNGPFRPGYMNGEISTSFFLFFFGIFLYLTLNGGVEPKSTQPPKV